VINKSKGNKQMKLKIIALLLFILSIFVLSACSADKASAVTVPAKDLVTAAVAGYSVADVPDSFMFLYGAADGSEN
jgi:uncharacterized lipoprotein YajG